MATVTGGDLTVAQARQWVASRRAEGARCPCCGQHAQEYRRTIHSGMARSLVAMYAAHGREWQDKTATLRGLGSASRDESLLRYWLLLEEATEPRPDGGRAGWWRVTGLGQAFITGGLRVQRYARVYDGACLGLEGEPVSIHQCLGKRFNLQALLEGRGSTGSPQP